MCWCGWLRPLGSLFSSGSGYHLIMGHWMRRQVRNQGSSTEPEPIHRPQERNVCACKSLRLFRFRGCHCNKNLTNKIRFCAKYFQMLFHLIPTPALACLDSGCSHLNFVGKEAEAQQGQATYRRLYNQQEATTKHRSRWLPIPCAIFFSFIHDPVED